MQPVIASWISDWATDEQRLSMFSFLTGGIFVFYTVGPLISGVLMHAGASSMEQILMVTMVIRVMQPLVILLCFPSDAQTSLLAGRNRQSEHSRVLPSSKRSAADNEGVARTSSPSMGDDLHATQFRAWLYLVKEHGVVVLVSLLLTLVGKAFLKNFPIFMAKELGMQTHEMFYAVGAACAFSIAMQLIVVPLLNVRFHPLPNTMLLASVLAQLIHLAVMACAQSQWPLWATIFLPGVIISADPVVQTVVAASGEAGGLSQGVKQGALSGMRIAAASLGPITYTLVEAAHPRGARAAWVSQGMIVLPALLLLLWKRRATTGTEGGTHWPKEYNT